MLKRGGLLPRDARKVLEEVLDFIPGVHVVEECLHGNARACEHWLAAKDIRRAANSRLRNHELLALWRGT
jgi:hypothetical protein